MDSLSGFEPATGNPLAVPHLVSHELAHTVPNHTVPERTEPAFDEHVFDESVHAEPDNAVPPHTANARLFERALGVVLYHNSDEPYGFDCDAYGINFNCMIKRHILYEIFRLQVTDENNLSWYYVADRNPNQSAAYRVSYVQDGQWLYQFSVDTQPEPVFDEPDHDEPAPVFDEPDHAYACLQ